MFRSVSLLCAVFYFYMSCVVADWICPVGNKFCFQRINEPPRTWNETRARCAQIGGDIPGANHLHVLNHIWVNENPFWTSLCFSNGRLQWLGTSSYEERNLVFINTFLPDLATLHDVGSQMYCFHTNGNKADPLNTFGLTLKDSQHLIGSMCVSDYRSTHSFIEPTPRGHVLSVSVVAEGTDIDWGPIGQNRDGFVNIFPLKAASLTFKCVVKTTYDVHKSSVRTRWIRNNGYLGNFSQVVTFVSEGDLIPWIGFINCEASYFNHHPVHSQGFHLVMWNTVTARLVSTCISCRLQSILETAKIILAQFVELEITPGKGTAMEFYNEPPVISQTTISFMIHMRNKKIDKFDFRMVQKLGKEFQLSLWAKSRSLFLPDVSDLILEIISPCNMALPQDRKNITWVGYLGQTVPSGNFIDGPMCVNNHGEIVTRRARCGLSNLHPIPHEECSSMKIRREDPHCFNGFEPADGKCYQMTEATNFATAIAKCWVEWPIQREILKPDSLSNWVQTSREWIYRTHHSPASLVWLPLRRLNSAAPLQTPVWSWNTVSNQWIRMANDWNTTVESLDINTLCAAYDLGRNKIISTSCQNHLPIICSRPLLSQPVNTVRSGDVGEYFCDPGWLTHWLVLDTGICYKRFTLNEAIDADEAQQFCIKQGGHLANAPTHSARIALEQVYSYFNNRSVVDSWIGLRNRDDQPGTFSWVNETTGGHSTTYNWHPYNEFTDGYASAFRNGMWWNWPRYTKLWGLVCQKNVSDWKDGIRLLLEPSNSDSIREGEYALVFTYEPKPILQDENDDHIIPKVFETKKLFDRSYLTKSFWLSDFDVVCHFTNYVRRFSFPMRGFRRNNQYRALVPVSTTMGSGPLTCEAWLNRPAFRFQSNTIIHRPAQWYNFVIIVSKQNLLYPGYHQSEINWNVESAVNDLLQRLELNRFRYFKDFLKNFSIVTINVEPFQNSSTGITNTTINYLVSFFLSPDVQRFDLFASMRKCQVGLELKSSIIDYESILHLLLQFCLPLIYKHGADYQFIEVRSTIACPSIRPFETFGHQVHDETSMTINKFAWPTTNINQITRSIHPCLIKGHIVHRTCVGSFEQGATWGPPKIMELNETLDEATAICQILDFTNSKLYQLERMTMAAFVDGRSTDVILKELLTEWEQPNLSMASLELTISSLSQILNGSRNQIFQINRLLVTAIIERMVQPGKCPLMELQFLPDVLDDFIQLFSSLPVLDNRGSRIRLNIGDHQVSVVAEGIDSTLGNQHSASNIVIDFNRLSVTVEKNPDNTVLSTIVTVLPSELLAIDPVSKNSIVNLYKVDTNDRTQKSILGKFIASQTIVHVNLKSVIKTSTTPFMLALKEDGSSLPENTYVCARWDSRLNGLHGGWLTGDCWYLGLDEFGTHLCQCYSSGIYGFFHTEESRTLSLALIRRLPIVINVVLFFFITSCLIIRSVFVYRKAVREMDLVELGVRLQLVIAWLIMLCCHLGQYFVSAHIVCVVLTTIFQFFLTAAFFWQIVLLVVRRWQLHQRWISNQNACLAKLSFAVWALSSITVVTIPIYKWKYVDAKQTVSECWLEDPIDFGLTVAIVCLASIASFILNMKNLHDQREFGVSSVWNGSDLLVAISTPLMCIAGLLAILDNSWLHSTLVSIIFSFASSLFGLIWLCTFWTVVANPMVKHKFQHSNHKIVHDLELKTVYGSSIEYLTDR